jgi:hypothetical protein
MRSALAGVAAACLVAGAVIAPASATTTHARLSVLNAVPGLVADVWVDGERILEDVAPGALAGTLDVPAGGATLVVTDAAAPDDGTADAGPLDVDLHPGASATAVAHLDAGGAPTATLFPDDASATAPGEGRLTVRHVAAAPAVDVLAGGAVVLRGLAPGQEGSVELPVGTPSITLAATETGEPVLGPAGVTVAEGRTSVLYAWGSLDAGTLASRTVGPAGPAPRAPAGPAGLVTDPVGPDVPAWSYAVVAIAAALALAALGRGRAARRVRPRE